MMWRMVCKLFGHLENSVTIQEWVFSETEVRTVMREYTLLFCDRCGAVL